VAQFAEGDGDGLGQLAKAFAANVSRLAQDRDRITLAMLLARQ
jgi:hypothetical protein